MTDIRLILCVYLILVNLIGFEQMGADKKRAIRGAWRIPEARLFFWALIGGSLGAWVGMYFFHHKTRHWYFRWGIPAILVIQSILGIWLTVYFDASVSLF